jgi:lipopolysaccharide heptosyltransferase I
MMASLMIHAAIESKKLPDASNNYGLIRNNRKITLKQSPGMNILIVKTSAIGDVIQTLPALNALRKHYPGAHITWLVEEAAADIISGHPALDRILVSKRKRWSKELLGLSGMSAVKEIYRFIKQLRDTKYDLVIDFQSLLKSSVWIALTRAKRKVGFGQGMEHAEHSYIFLNERIPPVNMNHHAVLRDLMLLEALGIDSKEIIFNFPIHDQARKQVDNLLALHGIIEKVLLIAINPVAKWETKLWSNRKFAELADRLIEQYLAQVIFTGDAGDRKTIADIMSHMNRKAVNLSGETSLKTLAALYAKADLVISTDTGPMHMAAAVGTPVVALFGPTAPWRTGPFGEAHQIIRTGTACSPCFKRQCPTLDCMQQIRVEDVLEGVQRLRISNRNANWTSPSSS